ncbi:MAG: hypothetical protein KJ941_03890, partial [Bacteroidetes bacterium]|nr:hypothetical protein [Bacteroidota bacterium]
HATYERLFHERLSDLVTLCRKCHEAITNRIRKERYRKRKVRISAYKSNRPKILRKETIYEKINVQNYRRTTPPHA